MNIPLSFAVLPTGHLDLYIDEENKETIQKAVADKILNLFANNKSIGLLRFGINNFSELPSALRFWHQFVRFFITEVCKLSGLETLSDADLLKLSLSPPINEFRDLLESMPFMRGSEYVNSETLTELWQNLAISLREELTKFNGKIQDYFDFFNATWNKVGKVCFHLVENKVDSEYPFAFLATYTTRVTDSTNVKHLPLSEALKEYSSKEKRKQFLSLLLPIQKASNKSVFIKDLVDTGRIFKPQAWNSKDTYKFLQSIPVIEEAGVIVRVPNWWNSKKPPRPQVKVSIGDISSDACSLDALLDFNLYFCLPDGDNLTMEDIYKLVNDGEKLIKIRGQWVEVDSEKLNQVLNHWKNIEQQVKNKGISFAEGMRILAGDYGQNTNSETNDIIAEWSKVVEGPWLNNILNKLRNPEQDNKQLEILERHLNAKLRHYQQIGMQWLWWSYNLKLGGCLADDMGLGKTIQMISLLLLIKYHDKQSQMPHLLILPASLLGNWTKEIKQFAPTLRYLVVHSSVLKGHNINEQSNLSGIDLVITTYAYAYRISWLNNVNWDVIIIDEAQNIKNPAAKQTKFIKQIKGQVRFALTGTPVENRLLDLWSLFDFVAPNLLGISKAFSNYGKKPNETEQRFYGIVRKLISPYILRRLKSNKQIISDLPDKTEIDAYCYLTEKQIALYQCSIKELRTILEQGIDGIKRKGTILSYLMRLKQICNHPSQWLGHGEYSEQESGKFIRMKELCEVIAEKQEKLLVFTQFIEIIPALSNFVSSIFKKPGLTLHGSTSVKERTKLIERFSQEDGPPFFILSLKAGGVGLNLTNASHVIHFDRWWNPAVENQATDRAYRIGQKKNVLVHKFICQGTIEEKIDSLIRAKMDLSDKLLTSDNDATSITDLSNDELLKIITLDIGRALGES